MIIEKYGDKEFRIDESYWESIQNEFRDRLKDFKQRHRNNYVTLFTAFTPIDLAKFVYEELEELDKLSEYEFPMILDKTLEDKHYKNFAIEIDIVNEQEREYGDGNMIVYPVFVYESRSW